MRISHILVTATSIFMLLCTAPFKASAAICPGNVGEFEDGEPGSLRWALNIAASGATITFCPHIIGKLTLTNELVLTKNVTILGPGASVLAIDGNGAHRVFFISPGIDVTIAGLTITNGYVNPFDGAGGIHNDQATLTVSNCVIAGNRGYSGGAIYNGGAAGLSMVQILNSTIRDNVATTGGGIYNDAAGTGGNGIVNVFNSTFSGNYSQGFGGGIFNAGFGGGTGTVRIISSTFSTNLANSFGGGIFNNGGGIAAKVEIGNTILNVSSVVNSAGVISSLGYNLSSDDAGGFLTSTRDKTNVNPMLGPLQLNGGETPTHALTTSSPAVDAGTNFMGFATDQTGAPRTTNIFGIPDAADGTDIGAYELQAAAPIVTSASNVPFITGFSNAFKILAAGNPAPTLFVSGTLPAGVNLSSNGIFSGIPPIGSTGSYPFTIVASNGIPPLATQLFTLTLVDRAVVAARPGFNTNGFGWVLNGDAVNGGPTITNNVFTLTDGAAGENRSGWFFCPLYFGGFQAAFTYQDIGGGGADGCAFVVQNDPRGRAALGFPGGGLGYVNITPSVAVLLNIYALSPGGRGLMLGTNGIGAFNLSGNLSGRTYQSTAPVNLAGGNPIAVVLRYTSGILEVSLRDTVTSANFQTNIPVDIPMLVGTNAGWVGITGSEGGILSHQIVSNFSYRPLPTLAVQRSQASTLVFTWPATVFGFALQSNLEPSNPANWVSVAAAVTQTNNLNQVTIPLPLPPQFYRLILPSSP